MKQTCTILLDAQSSATIPIIGFTIFILSCVMLIVSLISPSKALFWYKGERTKKTAAFTYFRSLVVGLLVFVVPLACTDSNDNKKVNTVPTVADQLPGETVIKLDTPGYYKNVANLSTKQIDSLINLQIDKDSNHVAFSKIYKAELQKNNITPTQIFGGMDGSVRYADNKFFYWKYFIRLQYAGSYKMHNDQNETFPQSFSIKAVYDLFGNLISIEKRGLQDASIAASTKEDMQQYKELLAKQERCYTSVTAYIKEHMNSPESFELVSQDATRIIDSSYIVVTERFRGKNAYNATVLNEIVAKCDVNGNILKITDNK